MPPLTECSRTRSLSRSGSWVSRRWQPKGVVYTGGTGEDYAIQGRTAIVLETLGADEIVERAEQLARQPEAVRQLRRAAYRTTRSFTWESVVGLLLTRLQLTLAGALR